MRCSDVATEEIVKYIVRYEENKARRRESDRTRPTPHGHGLDASGRIHWVHVWVVGSIYAMSACERGSVLC